MTEMITNSDVRIGDSVKFFDPHGRSHDALVTAVWGYSSKEAQDQHNRDYYEKHKDDMQYIDEKWLEGALAMKWSVPSLNVVYVDTDESKTDPYGRQITRSTSVVHHSNQAAHGMYWE